MNISKKMNSNDDSNNCKDPNIGASSSSSSSIYSSPISTPTGPHIQMSIHNNKNEKQINDDQVSADKCNEFVSQQNKFPMSDKLNETKTDPIVDDNIGNHHNDLIINSKQISENQNEYSINSIQEIIPNNEELRESEKILLDKEIQRLKDELNFKNEMISKMSRVQSQVENELEDLTASLFEEANKMVYSANVLRDKAEKELHEANLKIDMLTAEVQALKLLVITSTPSKPNAYLHPQMNSPKKDTSQLKTKLSLPIKSPSNYELGNKISQSSITMNNNNNTNISEEDIKWDSNTIGEIDPVFYEEFNEWRKCPTFEAMNSNFMKRIYDEEIYPVFNFKNKHLTSLVLRSIENNTLTVEAVNNDKLPFPKKCALLEVPRVCQYRMKIEDDQWHYICKLCRNRITTICDLFCYLRYVQDGLVKSNSKDIYWHIMKRRRNIALSKLGFLPIS